MYLKNNETNLISPHVLTHQSTRAPRGAWNSRFYIVAAKLSLKFIFLLNTHVISYAENFTNIELSDIEVIEHLDVLFQFGFKNVFEYTDTNCSVREANPRHVVCRVEKTAFTRCSTPTCYRHQCTTLVSDKGVIQHTYSRNKYSIVNESECTALTHTLRHIYKYNIGT